MDIEKVEKEIDSALENKVTPKKKSITFEKKQKHRDKVWKRLDEIIREVNDSNMSGRGSNYIGMGYERTDKDFTIVDPVTGLSYDTHSADGYSPEEMVESQIKEQRLRGMRGEGIVGGAKETKRRVRSDKGKKRPPSEWVLLVKAVAEYEGLPYNKALKVASEYRDRGYTHEDF